MLAGEPPGSQRHIAIGTYKKRVWIATNLSKTHPACLRQASYEHTENASIHAEIALLLQMPLKLRKKVKLYVIRVNKANHIRMSKPCEACQNLIPKLGGTLNNVFYTNDKGCWEKLIP